MATPNFSTYKGDFFSDTGLEWKTNVDTFIQYCQARSLDVIMKQQQDLLKQIIQELKEIRPVGI